MSPAGGADLFADLERLVRPRSIALVGESAAPGSAWHRGVENLLQHSRFEGEVFLVNPACAEAFGRPCHASLAALPAAAVDVACMLVGPNTVLASLADSGDLRIGHVIIWSPGFAEMGPEGAVLQGQALESARARGARLYGPNSPGVTNLLDGITLTPSGVHHLTPRTGPVGIASQGGGLGRNVMHNLHARTGIGLWLSAGNEADLGLPDFIAHFAAEPCIRVVCVVVEGLSDGRRFLAAVDAAHAAGKRFVVLKVGKSASGRTAVASHTASLAGSADVLSVALSAHGAIEVDDTDELADTAALLSRIGNWPGCRVCVLSFSGGANGLCCDHLERRKLPMSRLSPATTARLDAALSRYATRQNPLDIGAEVLSDPSSAGRLLDIVLADAAVDVVLVPIPMEHEGVTAALAHVLADAQARSGKLILPVWNTGLLGEGYHILCERGMTPVLTIAAAAGAIARIDRALRRPRPAPTPADGGDIPALPAGRFSEAAAKRLLAERGIAVPAGMLAFDAAQAVAIARDLGGPVVLKASGPDILHKSEHGLVMAGLSGEAAVRAGYETLVRRADAATLALDGILVEVMAPAGLEMLVGVHTDPDFGPVLTLGMGGTEVELRPDVARRLLPVDRAGIVEMLSELASAPMLDGYRGRQLVDRAALVALVARVAGLASPGVELELNPVRVFPSGAMALDAVLRVEDAAQHHALAGSPAAPAWHPAPIDRRTEGSSDVRPDR